MSDDLENVEVPSALLDPEKTLIATDFGYVGHGKLMEVEGGDGLDADFLEIHGFYVTQANKGSVIIAIPPHLFDQLAPVLGFMKNPEL